MIITDLKNKIQIEQLYRSELNGMIEHYRYLPTYDHQVSTKELEDIFTECI
jgi:hypothetical protein